MPYYTVYYIILASFITIPILCTYTYTLHYRYVERLHRADLNVVTLDGTNPKNGKLHVCTLLTAFINNTTYIHYARVNECTYNLCIYTCISFQYVCMLMYMIYNHTYRTFICLYTSYTPML